MYAFPSLCALCAFLSHVKCVCGPRSLCVCVCFEVKPKLPQQAEASPPGSVHWCRPSVSVAPAGSQFIPRPNTPIPTGRPTGGSL